MMEANYSTGIERDEKRLDLNNGDPRKWSNPLESRYVSCIHACKTLADDTIKGYPMRHL